MFNLKQNIKRKTALRWQVLKSLNSMNLQKINDEQDGENLNVTPAIAKPLGVVLHERLISTLARKESEYSEVCHWFETEYDSFVSAETVRDWEKKGIEINAQIKLLRFLLSDDV